MSLKKANAKAVEEYSKTRASFCAFMQERCQGADGMEYLTALCCRNGWMRQCVVEFILSCDLSFEDYGQDTETGRTTDQNLKKLKRFIYEMLEQDFGVLVQYKKDVPAKEAEGIDLIPGELYNLLGVDDDGNYILVDETGGEWAYPPELFFLSYMIEGGKGAENPQLHCKKGQRMLDEGDFEEAIRCFSWAMDLAREDNPIDMEEAVDGFLEAYRLLTQDIEEQQNVPALMDKAAQGDSKALCRLAAHYMTGSFIEQDEARAVALYEKAAAAGNEEAILALATIYDGALGVEEDKERAAELLRRLPL